MARDGYIEAKNARSKAVARVLASEVALADVETLDYPTELKEVHRSDRQRNLEAAQAELIAAESALAVFNPDKKASADLRSHFDFQMHVHLSLNTDMHVAMKQRCLADSIGSPELIRRALAKYLKG